MTRLHKNPYSMSIVAAICGFWVVGLCDSLIDAPRVSTLFFLLCFAALLMRASTKHPRTPVERSGDPRSA
jgi:hypothetical protein